MSAVGHKFFRDAAVALELLAFACCSVLSALSQLPCGESLGICMIFNLRTAAVAGGCECVFVSCACKMG